MQVRIDLADYFDWRLNEPDDAYPIELPTDGKKHYGVEKFGETVCDRPDTAVEQ